MGKLVGFESWVERGHLVALDAWTADRLPITVEPRPGEALESWIGAYARRLRTTGHDLMAHLGLGGTRITQMAVRLHEHEAAILKRATGVSGQDLTAMTLERYDGLVLATEPGRRAVIFRSPAGRFGSPRARYCPACLARDDGRGPVTWLLPWSFACPLHRILLLDACPVCHRPPRPWNTRRLGPRASGSCTRNTPRQAGPVRACGGDLTRAAVIPLPAAGLVLAAHEHLAALMTSPPGGRPAALAALRQVYALAGRVLLGLHAVPGQAPPVVRAVVDEAGAALPLAVGVKVGADTRSTAIGAALARIALDDAHPEHDRVFGWILQADRAPLAGRQSKPGIGAVAKRWAWSGPDMVSRVLARLDGEASLHVRLRYATATPRSQSPDLPAGAITRRAAMLPAMLWPGWTMRLLPLAPGSGAPAGDPGPGSFYSFRRGCASFLLLPGGPAAAELRTRQPAARQPPRRHRPRRGRAHLLCRARPDPAGLGAGPARPGPR